MAGSHRKDFSPQAYNWHIMGTARYHGLEHQTRSSGAGMYYIDQSSLLDAQNDVLATYKFLAFLFHPSGYVE